MYFTNKYDVRALNGFRLVINKYKQNLTKLQGIKARAIMYSG